MSSQDTNGVTERLPVHNPADRDDQDRRTLTRLKKKLLPGTRVVIIIWLIIYGCLIGVGIYGINKCPVEKYIPMYLIATGAIGILSKLLNCCYVRVLPFVNLSLTITCLYTVEVVLLIFGSYWVYKEFKPSYDPNDGNLYCNKIVYILAFVYISVVYVVTAVVLTGFMVFLICIFFVKITEPRPDPEAPRH